jgi:hypothetical protein
MIRVAALTMLRRQPIAKGFAIVLMILAASPLTAPFSTFDAAELLNATAVHADGAKLKIVDDLVDPAFADIDAVWLGSVPLPSRPFDRDLTEAPHVRFPVLRI